jgi:hypothetical protein
MLPVAVPAYCREQSSLADWLAKMLMDVDTALHALLRKADIWLAGLQLLTKAVRPSKCQAAARHGWRQRSSLQLVQLCACSKIDTTAHTLS